MQVLPPSSTGGPSRLFIMRPVATTLLMVAILLAGIIGYRALPVSALPEVDYPTIQVVTLYPGASPDVMTSAVTAPLERQFGQMSGLKQMSSSRKCRPRLTLRPTCCRAICLTRRFTAK